VSVHLCNIAMVLSKLWHAKLELKVTGETFGARPTKGLPTPSGSTISRDMRLIRIIGILAWSLGGPLPLIADTNTSAALPSYLVKFTAETVRADGKIDETAWAAAPWSTDFVWIEMGDAAPLSSRFKAMYTRQGLHFAFEFESPRAPGETLDPDFPYACEIFLDPEGRGRHYLEYAIAPDGAEHSMVWQGKLSVREWKAELGIRSEAGVARTALDPKGERLSYEISFPWTWMASLMGKRKLPPARGESWRANFSRVEAGEFAGDYSWAPMGGVYYMHNPGCFGWLVFAGEENPLATADAAPGTPLEDDVFKIAGSRRFPLFSRTLWPGWLISPAQEEFHFAVSKTYVTRLDAEGRAEWRLTRKDGLPQFIRSLALVGDKLYVAGLGINAGVATVTDHGSLRRVAEQDRFVLDIQATLFWLGDNRAVAASGNRFQIITSQAILPAVEAGAKVQCAVAIPDSKVAIGTANAIELYDATGKLIQRTIVAGGITSLARLQGAAIGVSGKNGLYRMLPTGECGYWPRLLRTKFDRVYTDSRGRCWAAFEGGLVLIEAGEMRIFNEPRGVMGFQISGAAEMEEGTMVFACTVPNAHWYGSTLHSSFLLTCDGKRCNKYTFRDGLPGQLNSLSKVDGDVFLCTNTGIFRFRK